MPGYFKIQPITKPIIPHFTRILNKKLPKPPQNPGITEDV
jgi:hypothetical protein